MKLRWVALVFLVLSWQFFLFRLGESIGRSFTGCLSPHASRLSPVEKEPGAPAVVILSVGATGGRPD